MKFPLISGIDSIFLYVIFGIIWGWIAMGVNALTGAFTFESSLLHNLAAFSTGGAILSIVVGGCLSLLSRWLPFKNVFLRAVFISTLLWGILMIGGIIFSAIQPERYHLVVSQSVQGFVLAGVMGCLLGLLAKIKEIN